MNGLSTIPDFGREFPVSCKNVEIIHNLCCAYLLELKRLLGFLHQLLHIVPLKQPTEDSNGELEP